MEYDGEFSGVEVDCYSHGFNQKVQLLLHFKTSRLDNAHTMRAMLRHTRTYRASQLFDFMHTITAPMEDRIEEAARTTGADLELVEFVRHNVTKVQRMVEERHADLPEDALKNKLLRNYFNALRTRYDGGLIDRIQTYLSPSSHRQAHFTLRYFYRTSEVIEEAGPRAGSSSPHPEQFWPILLADYDVTATRSGTPVPRYTDFLITAGPANCLGRSSRPQARLHGRRHAHGREGQGSAEQNPRRRPEIGYQPAWDDLEISKRLILSGMSREIVIREYRDRLMG
jgi:hypothetical protein